MKKPRRKVGCGTCWQLREQTEHCDHHRKVRVIAEDTKAFLGELEIQVRRAEFFGPFTVDMSNGGTGTAILDALRTSDPAIEEVVVRATQPIEFWRNVCDFAEAA